MIRVLHIYNMMENGGIEHFVMDRYKLIDREKIQFDFLLTSGKTGFFDKEIQLLGGKVFYTFPLTKNPIKAFNDIKRIIKENKYDIIHRHTGNAIGYFDLWAAKFGGAKHLILHSHNASAERMLIHNFSKLFLKCNCIRLACSNDAGNWLFGNKPFTVVNNAIDLEAYKFNEDLREKYRAKYGVENAFVVGHIGRMDYQKNHSFLLDIFDELLKVEPNAKLMCIGDGHLKGEIEEKARKLGIQSKIIFTGNINNVNEIINCFDVFCLPSKYEGFSLTLMEAQANGLKCIVSKGGVSIESNVTGNVEYVDSTENLQIWANKLMVDRKRCDIQSCKELEKFDIHKQIKELEKFYLSLGE